MRITSPFLLFSYTRYFVYCFVGVSGRPNVFVAPHDAWLADNAVLLTEGLGLQLANVLQTEQLFYACIVPFILFFGAFAFVMYPLRTIIHPTG